jgi:hypothetical protein
MLEIQDVRAAILSLIGEWLATYKVPSGQIIPAIWIGEPPPGTTRNSAGIECVIQRAPNIRGRGFVDGNQDTGLTKIYTIQLDLWQPRDIDPSSNAIPILWSLDPAITRLIQFWGGRLSLVGQSQPDYDTLERAVLRLTDAEGLL